jgi:hypothetical protein
MCCLRIRFCAWRSASSWREADGTQRFRRVLVSRQWQGSFCSPFGRPELVTQFVTDPKTPVVCYPRNCDSLAFYTGRSDFNQVGTRDTNDLIRECHHRPRTVILFTHEDSLAGFRNVIPPSIEIVETVDLRRKYGRSLLDRVFGSTPWGLCDVVVVVPKGQAGATRAEGTAQRR